MSKRTPWYPSSVNPVRDGVYEWHCPFIYGGEPVARPNPASGGIMKPLYIFDLDGTLALIEHRRHFVERERGKQDWKGFYAACGNDEPNYPVIATMERLRRFADILIFSGRSDEVRKQTVDWLVTHTSFCSWELDTALMMRQAGDYTADDVLKRQWLDAMLDDDRRRIVAVFDDRDRVVKMWRDAGVACFQVADGGF